MKIIQMLTSIFFGDAVGNDTLALKGLISESGFETQIYAEHIDPRLPKGTALPVSKIPSLKKDDILIVHESIGTELNVLISSFDCRKVMIYHNITPPFYFFGYSSNSAYWCHRGYEEIANLTDTFDMILSASAYNRQKLLDMGFTAPNHVLPILIPFDDYKKEPSKKILTKYRDDGFTNIIFVTNKKKVI